MTSARSPISILYLSILYLSTCIAVAETASATSVATFDDLGLGVEDEYHGEDSAGGFDSGGAYFVNNFDTLYGSWDGFAASTTTDTTTGAWSNQYSAITGGGEGGSAAYGVGYWSAYALSNPTIEFATERSVLGSYVTNTTYTYSSMLNGDSFAKQFGGESGDDPDWFLLSIFGYDTSGELTSSIDFYLADYRFGDNSQDYLVDDWEYLDLSGLGSVKTIEFTLSSSDTGESGMNTPSYFALDTLSFVPEPGVPALLFVAGIALALRHRRCV